MKKYIALATLALVVVGCENSDNIPIVDDGAMRIEVAGCHMSYSAYKLNKQSDNTQP